MAILHNKRLLTANSALMTKGVSLQGFGWVTSTHVHGVWCFTYILHC